MEVLLKYGDGFFGRDYRLFVGPLVYVLKDNCGGSDYDEIEAYGKAVRILEERHPDIPLDVLEGLGFIWDGTL